MPPRVFLGALAALLPDDTVTDGLQPDLLTAYLTACHRPSEGGTTWVTTGLVGQALFHVRVEAADRFWAWDHHLDDRMMIESFTAWIRPLDSLKSISLVSAGLVTPRDRDFVPHAKWALNFERDVLTLPYDGLLDAQAERAAWNLIEAIRDARFLD